MVVGVTKEPVTQQIPLLANQSSRLVHTSAIVPATAGAGVPNTSRDGGTNAADLWQMRWVPHHQP